MHQQDVDVVRVQFPAETVDVRAHLIRVAGNGFGQNHDLLPRNMLERLSHMRVRTILIGGVIKPQTVVVAPPQEVAEPLDSQGRLVRMMADADGASTAGEAAGVDARFPQHDDIRPAEPHGGRRCQSGQFLLPYPSSAHTQGCFLQEVSAFHTASRQGHVCSVLLPKPCHTKLPDYHAESASPNKFVFVRLPVWQPLR